MASSILLPPIILVIISMLISVHTVEVQCVEFDVGGDKGWATPPSKNQLFYNDWASKNRFNVNDTIRFVYKKDSVMAVTEEEYEKCRPSQPAFFDNDGDTLYNLTQPGLYYFISGVATHCQKGLKMVVKVLEPESLPPAPAAKRSSATAAAVFGATEFVPLAAALAGVMLVIF